MSREQMYRDYLEKKPGDRFAMYSLALELKKHGQHDAAQVAFVALLEAHPQSGAGHYQYGLLYAEQGLDELARAAWTAGLSALEGSDDPEARRSLSEIQGALDDLD